MKSLIFLKYITIFVLLFSGCHVLFNQSGSHDTIKNIIISDTLRHLPVMNFKINDAAIKDSLIYITVEFNEGRAEQEFALLSDGLYFKSLPPQIFVCLVHKSNRLIKDTLKEIKHLTFNLSKIKYPGTNEVSVRLMGYDPWLNYKY